jgi:hypothetical protein
MRLLALPVSAVAGPLLLRKQAVDDYSVDIDAAGRGKHFNTSRNISGR